MIILVPYQDILIQILNNLRYENFFVSRINNNFNKCKCTK